MGANDEKNTKEEENSQAAHLQMGGKVNQTQSEGNDGKMPQEGVAQTKCAPQVKEEDEGLTRTQGATFWIRFTRDNFIPHQKLGVEPRFLCGGSETKKEGRNEVVDFILGIKATPQGLEISPCIPKDWKGFSVKRTFRSSVYNITVKNPDNVSSGVACIKVNGKEIKGNLIKPLRNATVSVEVILV
jgi:hypothetical protein